MSQTTQKRLLGPILWNTSGSLYYFACQWLMTVFVARFDGGFANAGVLTLAVSLTNIFSAIALFAVRNYQVSDIDSHFGDAEYGRHRAFTCALSAVACTLFLLPNRYNAYTFFAILLYLGLKLNEAFCDYLHGILQKHWRLDAVGKSYFLRGTLILCTFLPVLYFTENLILALGATVLSNLTSTLLYDYAQASHYRDRRTPRKGSVKDLTHACAPLLVYSLAVTAIPSISRYFLENLHGTEALGIYGSATTVAAVIQAVTAFLFNPLVGVFAECHKKQNKVRLRALVGGVLCTFVALTAAAMLICPFVREWGLVLLMGEKMRAHAYLLDAAILASCITGLIWFLGTLLTVLRAYYTMIGGALCGVLTSFLCSFIWIEELSFRGVTLTNITSLSVVAAIYLLRCGCYLLCEPHPTPTDENPRGKRLLVVCQHFWPEAFRLNDLCDGFVEEGVEVDVLCGHPNYPRGEWFEGYNGHNHRHEKHNGVKIRRVFEIKRGKNTSARILINYLTFPFASLFHLPALLRRHYDRVFIYSLSPVYMGIAGIAYGRLKNTEITTYVMDLWPENLYSVLEPKSRLARRFLLKTSTWFYKKSDKLICLSEKAKEVLMERTGKDERAFLVLPQCCEKLYETPIFDPALQETYAHRNTIVYTGNISPAQDFDTLIEAAARLVERGTDVHFLIVGDGMSKKDAQAAVAARGLDAHFTFVGFVPMEEIPRYTAVATALVATLCKSPLLDCTVPAKVMSYIAAAKPIVLAMDGEAQTLVREHHIGFAGDCGDAQALCDNLAAVCAMRSAERDAMAERARALHLSRFERNANLKILSDFLFSLPND